MVEGEGEVEAAEAQVVVAEPAVVPGEAAADPAEVAAALHHPAHRVLDLEPRAVPERVMELPVAPVRVPAVAPPPLARKIPRQPARLREVLPLVQVARLIATQVLPIPVTIAIRA